jgi:hypothetical protein
MSAHTPGPWWPRMDGSGRWGVKTYRDKEESDPYANYGCEYGATICGGIGDHTEKRTYGNGEANAHLIAAAPDLLEALEAALLLVDMSTSYRREDIAQQSRAAIAKAKGETQ